jgi:hypothetical protein
MSHSVPQRPRVQEVSKESASVQNSGPNVL